MCRLTQCQPSTPGPIRTQVPGRLYFKLFWEQIPNFILSTVSATVLSQNWLCIKTPVFFFSHQAELQIKFSKNMKNKQFFSGWGTESRFGLRLNNSAGLWFWLQCVDGCHPAASLFVLYACLRRCISISSLKTIIPRWEWEASFMALDWMHIRYCSGVSSSAQCFSCQRWKRPGTGVRITMRSPCKYFR